MSIQLEEQIKVLEMCDIRLRPGITIDNLLYSYDREKYEKEPYVLLLIVMGGELEEEPFEYISKDIWHFDTECIEDHGHYVAIAQRMSDLAGGSLPLEEITDYVEPR